MLHVYTNAFYIMWLHGWNCPWTTKFKLCMNLINFYMNLKHCLTLSEHNFKITLEKSTPLTCNLKAHCYYFCAFTSRQPVFFFCSFFFWTMFSTCGFSCHRWHCAWHPWLNPVQRLSGPVCVCVCDRPLLCRPGMQGTDNQICENNRPKGWKKTKLKGWK